MFLTYCLTNSRRFIVKLGLGIRSNWKFLDWLRSMTWCSLNRLRISWIRTLWLGWTLFSVWNRLGRWRIWKWSRPWWIWNLRHIFVTNWLWYIVDRSCHRGCRRPVLHLCRRERLHLGCLRVWLSLLIRMWMWSLSLNGWLWNHWLSWYMLRWLNW